MERSMAFQRKTRPSVRPLPEPQGGHGNRPAFNREAELPKLVGLWPAELRDMSAEATAKIIALLRKAIRAERRRGQSGHWTYDLTRHLALSEALKAEEYRFDELTRREIVDAFRQRIVSTDRSAGGFASAPGRAKLIGDADG
jgi:hypothetical protein